MDSRIWAGFYESRSFYNHIYSCLLVKYALKYILNNYDNIVKFANVIENRIYDEINQTELIVDNQKNLEKCIEYNLNYILIDDEYNIKL